MELEEDDAGPLIPAAVRAVEIWRCTVVSIILRIASTEMLASPVAVPEPDATSAGSIGSDGLVSTFQLTRNTNLSLV